MAAQHYCSLRSVPMRCFYDYEGMTKTQHVAWLHKENKGYYLTLPQVVELQMNTGLDCAWFTMYEGKNDPNTMHPNVKFVLVLHEKDVTNAEIRNNLASINVEIEPGTEHIPYRKITFVD